MKNILKEIKKINKGCYVRTIQSIVDDKLYTTLEYVWLGKCSLKFRHKIGKYDLFDRDVHRDVKISLLRFNDPKNIVSVIYNQEDKRTYNNLLCYCMEKSIPDEGIVYEQSRKAKKSVTKPTCISNLSCLIS